MLKRPWMSFAALAAAAALTLSAAAQDRASLFALEAEEAEGITTVSVVTDQAFGVGGLDLTLEFDPKLWQAVEDTVIPGMTHMDIICDNEKGNVRILWDTTDPGAGVNSTLMKIGMQRKTADAPLSSIWLTVQDYYDNTTSMLDLEYYIQGFPQEEPAEQTDASSGGMGLWLALGGGAVVIFTAGVVFILLSRRKTARKF